MTTGWMYLAQLRSGFHLMLMAALVLSLPVGAVESLNVARSCGSSAFVGDSGSETSSTHTALVNDRIAPPEDWHGHQSGLGSDLSLLAKVDPATLTLITGFSSLLQAMAFGVLWRINPGIRGVGLWAVSASCNAVLMPLMWLRTIVDLPLLTMLLPTLLVVAAGGTFYAGAARFAGREPRWKAPAAMILPLFLGFLWFLLVDPQPHLRIACASSLFSVFLGGGAWYLLSERRPGLIFAARLCGLSTLVMFAIMALRGITLPFLGPSATLFARVPVQVLALLSLLAWVMVWGFFTVLLINQRHVFEREQSFQAKIAAEAALRQTQLELAAERAQRQRRRLVRDLHDGLGGVTANLALLASSEHAHSAQQPPTEFLRHIEELAVAGNRELRSLMNCLESGVAHWGDFVGELRQHAQQLAAAHGFKVDWHIAGNLPLEPITDFQAVLSLSRTVKEALSNLARHSGATRATVRLAFRSRQLLVLVRDNGCGIASAQPTLGGGRGLGNMRRRVEELGGSFSVSGKLGTRVLFSLPLPLQSWEQAVDVDRGER